MNVQEAQVEVEGIRSSVEQLLTQVNDIKNAYRVLTLILHAQEKVITSTFDTLEQIANEKTGCDWIARKTAAIGMKKAAEIYAFETSPTALGG